MNKAIGSLAAAFCMVGGMASAATVINVGGGTSTVTCEGAAATECYGLVGGNPMAEGIAATLSDSSASLYDLGDASETSEAQVLDLLLDGIDNDEFVTGDKTDLTDADEDSYTFESDAEYIAFKVGKNTFYLQLTAPGPVTLTFDKNGQKGGGLSHFTEFGQLATVPLPAAGLLLLFGIGGLSAMRRRKTA